MRQFYIVVTTILAFALVPTMALAQEKKSAECLAAEKKYRSRLPGWNQQRVNEICNKGKSKPADTTATDTGKGTGKATANTGKSKKKDKDEDQVKLTKKQLAAIKKLLDGFTNLEEGQKTVVMTSITLMPPRNNKQRLAFATQLEAHEIPLTEDQVAALLDLIDSFLPSQVGNVDEENFFKFLFPYILLLGGICILSLLFSIGGFLRARASDLKGARIVHDNATLRGDMQAAQETFEATGQEFVRLLDALNPPDPGPANPPTT
jgi:hypothetical protein